MLIDLAQQLYELHNYNGMMAIVSSLQQASVSRLKKTIALVDKSYMSKLNTLQVSNI